MSQIKQNSSANQSQSQKLSSFMLFYLDILQMNNQELVDYISDEAEKNPIIEVENLNILKSKNYEPLSLSAKTKKDDKDYDYIGSLEDTDESFYHYIIKQVDALDFSPTQKLVAINILELTDESGYLVESIEDIAKKLLVNLSVAKDVLEKMQKFEPSGVFARSLSECLKIQLKDLNLLDEKFEKILDNLNLILNGGIVKLAKVVGIELSKIQDYLKIIKRLNPKPANIFKKDSSNFLYYDVLVENDNGNFIIKLNSDVLPKILINNEYSSKIKVSKDKTEVKYLNKSLNQANQFIQALNQRAETLLKVSTQVVNMQKDFFEKGLYFFKPLLIKDIAEKVGYHESTVSRSIKNKYMKTPRGVFELKYFFSSKLGENESDEIASKVVRKHIKDLIEKEKANNLVLSDDEISEKLKDYGINIARRTVAKYREIEKIPSSADRKRLLKSGM